MRMKMRKEQTVIYIIFAIIILCFTLFILTNIFDYMKKENFSTKKTKTNTKTNTKTKTKTNTKSNTLKNVKTK